MSERLPDSPFQGLEPFTEEDRDYFFGREEDQQTIGANLITSQLTILYGASGVGKTSVLMAGVMPFVRSQPNVAVVLYRKWQVQDAFDALKQEIVRTSGAEGIDTAQPLDRVLQDVCRSTRKTIAIILDQFEEYFLYNAPGTEFDGEFARAVNREDIDANFLISIREDAVARLDRFQPYIPDVLGNYLRLDHLDLAGAHRAVEKPLAHYDEVAPPELRMEIEPALVDELIEQVRIGRVTVAGGGKGHVADSARIETPFLQMVLIKVWEAERAAKSSKMRLETLTSLGGAQTIVRDHVDAVMKQLTDDERAASAAVFDRLVTPSGSKIAYNAEDLKNFAGDRGDAVPGLLGKLSKARILREVAALGSPETRYEIFHDVLSGAVLAWRTKYIRAREEAAAKRTRRVVLTFWGIVALVVIAVVAWIERANVARAKEKTDLIAKIAALQAAKDESQKTTTGAAATATTLDQLLASYQKLGDKAGEASALAQLGDAASDQQRYDDAVRYYNSAGALTDNAKKKLDLIARATAASGDGYRKKGDSKLAAAAYSKAAQVYASNGDSVNSATMLTKAASVTQDAGDLDGALQLWNNALALERQTKDSAAQAKTLAGIASVEKLRKISEKPRQQRESLPAPVADCSPAAMAGVWEQGYTRPTRQLPFLWKFETHNAVNRAGAVIGVSLHIARNDGAVSGDFSLNGNQFEGALQWVNGDVIKGMTIATPDPKTKCGQVATNQPWYFVRTNASPAAAD